MALIGSFQPSKVSMLAIKCRDFRMFQFAPANMLAKKKKKKNCRRLSKNLCILRRQWLRHTSTFCQRLWFVFLMVRTILPKLHCLLITHLNMKRKTIFFSLITLFWFLRVFLPLLENKLSTARKTQNIAACRSQGKQRELSDPWKSIKI